MSSTHTRLKGESALGAKKAQRQIQQVLALSGGGYRGLFTAQLLERIETHFECRIVDRFSLVAGTSAGALIAAALAHRIPASQIRETFEHYGEKIFRRQSGWTSIKRLWRAPYDRAPLSDAITATFGQQSGVLDKKIGSLKVGLLVTAVDATDHRPHVFGGYGIHSSKLDITLRDAILASAAAPTYFPMLKMPSGASLVDGGLIANAPDLVALAYAQRIFACDITDIYMLGIGTACPFVPVSTSTVQKGIAPWLFTKRGLVHLTLDAQTRLACELTQQLLGDRYLVIDKAPNGPDASILVDFDRADRQSSEILKRLANERFEELKNSGRLRVLFH